MVSSMIIYRTQQNLVSGDLYETRMHARKWQEPELMTPRINSRAPRTEREHRTGR